jgi:transcriptional regulator with XRE-family HTH domain
MTLSIAERKYRLPYGKQKEIAEAEGVSESFVSNVLSATKLPRTERGWRTYRRVAVRIARVLKVPVDEAFPETRTGPRPNDPEAAVA